MRCLSCHEPWASALVHGVKTVEVRSWAPRGLKPGDWIAVHVSKRMDRWDEVMLKYWASRIAPPGPRFREIAALLANSADHRGCIIGAVRFYSGPYYWEDPVLFKAEENHHLIPAYFFKNLVNPMGWRFNDYFAIHPPIPWRGELGLFNIPFAVDPRIAEKGRKQVHGLVPLKGVPGCQVSGVKEQEELKPGDHPVLCPACGHRTENWDWGNDGLPRAKACCYCGWKRYPEDPHGPPMTRVPEGE